ncbi:Cro/Cl family transcriptional regulator [Pantoea cypripedii]|uniref:Cro/Cl family transcriptional regulator n=1 Tax=Pantoea cypripedii TaxID=55209 RepID=A0A1X1EX76_PANCY|nr:Cro/Cl family transcriptional regulator [Pantoea cypripedii]MBP2194704.1 polysaccharide pyruvyl transferase WcaK-like protein [Pantoea cypripedii]ORM94598.1 Cro/Cl family transcriptional regulator [Pantoea cypripedii]
MNDLKATSTLESVSSQKQTDLLNDPQVSAIVSALLPSLQMMIGSAMSDAMSVKQFAAMRGVSTRLVWQWIDEGILLKAPTKDFSNKEDMEKRSKVLINVKAWRDKLTQQAVDCHYIDARISQSLN